MSNHKERRKLRIFAHYFARWSYAQSVSHRHSDLALGTALLIVQISGDTRMIGTERFLVYCQRPLVQRFRIGIATLLLVQLSQIVQRCRDFGMLRTSAFSLIANERFNSGSASA